MFIKLHREISEMLHYHNAFEKFNHTMQFSMLRPFASSLTMNNVDWKLKNSESVSFYKNSFVLRLSIVSMKCARL